LKAVIYARYSDSHQRDGSIEGQIRECTEYANYNNITLIGTYIDRALSAKTDNHPEFQRMISDSAKHLFEGNCGVIQRAGIENKKEPSFQYQQPWFPAG